MAFRLIYTCIYKFSKKIFRELTKGIDMRIVFGAENMAVSGR